MKFWPLVTLILTWAKKWPKWFQNDFSRAFERCLSFFSTVTRSRDHGGGGRSNAPPPPSRRWKIQRPSRARVKFWKLEKILIRTVAVARAYTFLEVRSRDSSKWPDLMWPRHKNFTTDVKFINEKVCQVWLRCFLSFSSYPRKTTGGPKWPYPHQGEG